MPLNKLEGLRCYVTSDAAAVVARLAVYPGKERDTNQHGPAYRDTSEKPLRCGGVLRPDQAASEGGDTGATT